MLTELHPLARESVGILVTTSCIQNMRNPNSMISHDITTAVEDLVPYLSTHVLEDLQARVECQVRCFKTSLSTPDWEDLLDVLNKELQDRQDSENDE